MSNVAAKCLEALTGIAQRLEQLGAPKSGISLAQAVDTLWFYFGQNTWCSLVGEREWTFDRAEERLREAASRDLLRGAGPGSHPSLLGMIIILKLLHRT